MLAIPMMSIPSVQNASVVFVVCCIAGSRALMKLQVEVDNGCIMNI